MSNDNYLVLNSQEFTQRLSEMAKHLAQFEVSYDTHIKRSDKKRIKDICAMIRWEEQQMLNAHQGINWLYYGNWR